MPTAVQAALITSSPSLPTRVFGGDLGADQNPGPEVHAPAQRLEMVHVLCADHPQHHIALLAQLVARGSDKAKVIGSSPVESKFFF